MFCFALFFSLCFKYFTQLSFLGVVLQKSGVVIIFTLVQITCLILCLLSRCFLYLCSFAVGIYAQVQILFNLLVWCLTLILEYSVMIAQVFLLFVLFFLLLEFRLGLCYTLVVVSQQNETCDELLISRTVQEQICVILSH